MKKAEISTCCTHLEPTDLHPDHTREIHRINRISGQLEAIKRMITQREYCPKIITQIQAVRAALKSLESVVLEKHLITCVKGTLNSKDQTDANQKLQELIELFKKN